MVVPGGTTRACKHNRKCSKVSGHKGRCNSEKPVNSFWESSSVFQLNARKRKLIEEEKELDAQHKAKRVLLNDREEALKTTKIEIESKLNKKGKLLINRYIQYCVMSYDGNTRQYFIFNSPLFTKKSDKEIQAKLEVSLSDNMSF